MLVVSRATRALQLHQSPNRAAGYREGFPVHLLPDLGYVVDLHAGLPDRLDLRLQRFLAAARAPLLSLAAVVVCSHFARLDSAGHPPSAASHFRRKHF
ncbi:hypothetical protein [Burkholderia anthina]|uniref:hypothetical protein n=1 Tax=Burkholderia anthina TaxID=179879 RepID=UPI001AA04FF3|nr:hypothetical protein [Burkholderia anthina]QTD94942.1 hypothetical protein J4G50_33475 [Burkholderia anthina]